MPPCCRVIYCDANLDDLQYSYVFSRLKMDIQGTPGINTPYNIQMIKLPIGWVDHLDGVFISGIPYNYTPNQIFSH